jgi:TrmH family RNA methyltransferase
MDSSIAQRGLLHDSFPANPNNLTPLHITSSQNPRLKAAKALRDAKQRRRTGRFLIDGFDLFRKAVEGTIVIREVFIRSDAPGWIHDWIHDSIGVLASRPEIFIVDPVAMQKLQYGEASSDVIAVAESWDLSLPSLNQRLKTHASAKDIYLVLDRIEKPGNLGAALRTADAVGVRAVLLCDPICESFNPNSVRSSLGALFFVPLGCGSESEIQEWLDHQGIGVYAARVDGTNDYSDMRYTTPCAIVVGNEADGLAGRWQAATNVAIPMAGKIDSLNASVSTAVLLFEIARQNRSTP